jgi:hypothetical protein
MPRGEIATQRLKHRLASGVRLSCIADEVQAYRDVVGRERRHRDRGPRLVSGAGNGAGQCH